MQKADFKAGEHWAYRAQHTIETPAQRVELVALLPRKGAHKVKVRYLEGEIEGFEEFVPGVHLRCRWRDWKKVERDERCEATLVGFVNSREPLEDVFIQAANVVLAATGEDVMVDGYRRYSKMYDCQRPGLERVAGRAKLDTSAWRHHPCFIDREGALFMLDSQVVELAVAFAAAEPDTVCLYLDAEEQSYLSKGYTLGERYYHDQFLKQKPAWLLARSWVAKDGGRDPLHRELERLQRLLSEALSALERAGDERTVARLRRSWEGKG